MLDLALRLAHVQAPRSCPNSPCCGAAGRLQDRKPEHADRRRPHDRDGDRRFRREPGCGRMLRDVHRWDHLQPEHGPLRAPGVRRKVRTRRALRGNFRRQQVRHRDHGRRGESRPQWSRHPGCPRGAGSGCQSRLAHHRTGRREARPTEVTGWNAPSAAASRASDARRLPAPLVAGATRASASLFPSFDGELGKACTRIRIRPPYFCRTWDPRWARWPRSAFQAGSPDDARALHRRKTVFATG